MKFWRSMMWVSSSVTTVFLLQSTLATGAQLESSELFEMRTKLEAMVNEKYKMLISTRLPLDSFKVTSQIQLSYGNLKTESEPNKEEKKEAKDTSLFSQSDFGDLPQPIEEQPVAVKPTSEKNLVSDSFDLPGMGATEVTQEEVKAEKPDSAFPSDFGFDSLPGMDAPKKVAKKEVKKETPKPSRSVANVLPPKKVPARGVTPIVAKSEKPKRFSSSIPEEYRVGKMANQNLKISKVHISVSILKKMNPRDQLDFSAWIKSKVRDEFGDSGSVTLTYPAVDPFMPEKAPSHFWGEKVRKYQNLFGLMFFSIVMALSVLVWKLMPSRDVRDQRATAIRIQRMKTRRKVAAVKPAVQSEAPATNAENLPALISANTPAIAFEAHRNHQRKIAFLALSSDELVDHAFDIWMDESEDGRKKVVSVIDCVLSELSDGKLESASGKHLPEMWTLPEKIKKDKDVETIFRAYGSLPLQAKAQICEKAYWDLLSLKAMGNHSIKKRFLGVSQLAPDKIENVLRSQTPQVQFVTIMHLPPEKMSAVVDAMPYDEKKTIIEQAFVNPTINENELDVVDQTLDFVVKKKVVKEEEGKVDVMSMIPNVLKALNALEEVQVVLDICSKRPASADYLKVNYPSVAFLNEWPTDQLEMAIDRLNNDQLVAILQVLPGFKEAILPIIPLRYKAELRDLHKNMTMTDEFLMQHLQEVRNVLISMVSDKEVDLKVMFPIAHKNNLRNAS